MSRRQREHRVDDGLHGVRAHLAAAQRAERVADARPEQPQVVVDLGRRADGRARRLGRVLLLDRDGGREPVDRVDVGLLHALEELARVRRQRLDVAALSFGVDGVERQRGLTRSRRPGDDGEARRGISRSKPLRLCWRAPRTRMASFMREIYTGHRRNGEAHAVWPHPRQRFGAGARVGR